MWVISARLVWSNRDICSGPSSAARAAIAGARRAVTQPNPPRSRSSCTRALVIIPRSPTITMSLSLNVSLTAWTMVVNAVGSAVFPGNTRTATGRPAGSVSSPYSIWGRPFRSEFERVFDCLDDGGERGRVGGVPGKHPHRDRPPGRVGQQPVLDLGQAFQIGV